MSNFEAENSKENQGLAETGVTPVPVGHQCFGINPFALKVSDCWFKQFGCEHSAFDLVIKKFESTEQIIQQQLNEIEQLKEKCKFNYVEEKKENELSLLNLGLDHSADQLVVIYINKLRMLFYCNFIIFDYKIEEGNKKLFVKEIQWNEKQMIILSPNLLNINFIEHNTIYNDNEFCNDLVDYEHLHKLPIWNIIQIENKRYPDIILSLDNILLDESEPLNPFIVVDYKLPNTLNVFNNITGVLQKTCEQGLIEMEILIDQS
ncbi:hypothetical protein RFI_35233 [Reticulomyxa filosa]|uniref:Uncharacterized protein n=1 Tax=Reticulomyxa filosa TaxID=46433 RepID=X6LJR2_RETFI|nr:hypothetical protein RFI_35233 [Reticulomyxa filosa]|eukprot:ETO02203.1 hypothetical protein RFI_35233 [Reticulomyxa filosa]